MAIVIKTLSDSAQARKDLGDLRSSVQGIQKSTEGLADKFSNITRSLAIGGTIAASALAFTRLSDSMTNLQNRIGSVTGSAREAKIALASITDIAVRTRTGIDATAKLFTKLSGAAKDLGADSAQIRAVTEAITKSFKISGASAGEAASTITQLSQAFASGKLAGDEFNSVLENSPFLARKITEGMGISLKQLYKLRDDGKLFAKDVFGAILKGTDDIDQKFAKLGVTYGDAFTNLGNAFKLLFGAVTGSFSSARGGPADMLNNWAIGVAKFAANFGYYLLKAKTIAIVFIIDVTEFFLGMWRAVTEDGPDAIFKMFRDMGIWLKDFVSSMIPYGKQLADNIVMYSERIYAASTAVFLGFVAWLRKSDRTAGMADALEAFNNVLLDRTQRMIAYFRSINFETFYKDVQRTLKGMWDAIMRYDFSKLFSTMFANTKKVFNQIRAIDLNKFFPNMAKALEYVKDWSKKVAHWFWWIYDVVIGHSYIPDLINGVIAWCKKLLGSPLEAIRSFAESAGKFFAMINPFKSLTGGVTALTAAFGGLKAVTDKPLGMGGQLDAIGNKFKDAKKYATDFINEPVNVAEQNSVTGAVQTKSYKRTFLADQLRIPREDQAKIGVGIAAAIGGALYLFMQSGPLKTVVLSLFTTGAAAFLSRSIDQKELSKFFVNAASDFLGFFETGITKILGKNISADPFGFLALAAKTSLLFKGARDYFIELLTKIATAPTKAAIGFANNTAILGAGVELKTAERRLSSSMAKLDRRVDISGKEYTKSLAQLTRANIQSSGIIGPIDPRRQVDGATSAQLASNPLLRNAVNARDTTDALKNTRNAIVVENTSKLNIAKKAYEEVKADLKAKAKEAFSGFKEGAKTFFGGVGGIVGAGVGLEVGNNFLEKRRADLEKQGLSKLNNANLTTGGKALNNEQIQQVVKGEFDLKSLDGAGAKIAAEIVAGMNVPQWQAIGIQLGGVAAGQMVGGLVGALASGGIIWLAEKASVIFMAGLKKAYDLAGTAAVWLYIKAQAVALWALERASKLVTGALMGAQIAGAFLIGLVGWPVIIAAALVAAVIAVGYLIYKNWDKIWLTVKSVGTAFVGLLKAAWDDPKKFITKTLPDAIMNMFKRVMTFLPDWLGGSKTTPKQGPMAGGLSATDAKGNLIGKANGGYITGPGTGTSDSIMAMLSNGEYVINAAATKRNRGLLEAINSGQPLPKFKNGGAVGGGRIGVSDKLDEARSAMADAQAAAGKATVGWQRNAAMAVVRQWQDFINTLEDIQGAFNDKFGTDLTDTGTDEEKKKKKEKRDKAKKDSDKEVEFSFNEELDKINEIFPDLKLGMDEFLGLTNEMRLKIFDLIVPIKKGQDALDKLPAGSGLAFEQAKRVEEQRKKSAEEAAKALLPERDRFSTIGADLNKTGISLEREQFEVLDKGLIEDIKKYNESMQEWAKVVAENKANPELVRETRIKMIKAREATQTAISDQLDALAGDGGDLAKLGKADIGVEADVYNRMADVARQQIVAIADRIITLKKLLKDKTISETQRLQAQEEKDTLTEKAGEIAGAQEKVKQAGADFVATMKDSFKAGIFKFLKTGKLDVMSVVDTFVDKILNNFVNSLVDSFTGKGGFLDSIFTKIGQGSSSSLTGSGGIGSLLGGLFGGGKGPSVGSPGGSSGPVFGKTIDKLFGGGSKSAGANIAGGITNAAPKIGTALTDAAPALTDAVASAGPSLAGALKGLGGGSMVGGAAAAGSLVGLLIGKLFAADGGYVSGPGSGTSDSIPARLSNGEFVVKAKQVRKFRPLLHAINNGRQLPAFAEGGMVGNTTEAVHAISTDVAKTRTSIDASNKTTNLNITGDISRQTRKEVMQMIPYIASSVNDHNRERGVR